MIKITLCVALRGEDGRSSNDIVKHISVCSGVSGNILVDSCLTSKREVRGDENETTYLDTYVAPGDVALPCFGRWRERDVRANCSPETGPDAISTMTSIATSLRPAGGASSEAFPE